MADEKFVTLTFDDGPDPRFTPRILDILMAKQVPQPSLLWASWRKDLATYCGAWRRRVIASAITRTRTLTNFTRPTEG
jgi:hypothetical protein